MKQQPQAAVYARRAWQLCDAASRRRAAPPPWSDDLLAWHVRAALRQPAGEAEPLAADDPRHRRHERGRTARRHLGLLARPRHGGPAEPGAARRRRPRRGDAALESIAPSSASTASWRPRNWAPPALLPAAPRPLTDAEREAARGHAGLARALQLIDAGPAQRRRARMELHAARHDRPRTAGRRAAGLRARGLGPLHQHQRPHARRGRHGAALPDALPRAGAGAGARDRASTRPMSTA